jgi:drug/metabolite transporter (DMT)-like permease
MSGPVFIRYLGGHLDLFSQNFWRYLVAMLFWLPWLVLWRSQGRVTASLMRRAAAVSAVNIVLQSFWAWSYYLVLPGFGTLLTRSSLVWTAAFCMLYFPAERPLVRSGRFWAGAVLTVAGLAGIVMGREGLGSCGSMAGVAVALSAAVLWSAYTVAVKIAFAGTDARCGFAAVSVYTAAGLGVLAILFGSPLRVFDAPAAVPAAVAVSGVLSIAIAHVLYYVSISRIGATIPALLLQVSPFMTLVLSMVVFGERLRPWQWAGGGVLLAGSFLSILAQEHLKRS